MSELNIMEMAHKAVEFDHVQTILENYLVRTRGRTIARGDAGEWLVLSMSEAGILYNSPSYAACLEWVLKQPLIESDDK